MTDNVIPFPLIGPDTKLITKAVALMTEHLGPTIDDPGIAGRYSSGEIVVGLLMAAYHVYGTAAWSAYAASASHFEICEINVCSAIVRCTVPDQGLKQKAKITLLVCTRLTVFFCVNPRQSTSYHVCLFHCFPLIPCI